MTYFDFVNLLEKEGYKNSTIQYLLNNTPKHLDDSTIDYGTYNEIPDNGYLSNRLKHLGKSNKQLGGGAKW